MALELHPANRDDASLSSFLAKQFIVLLHERIEFFRNRLAVDRNHCTVGFELCELLMNLLLK